MRIDSCIARCKSLPCQIAIELRLEMGRVWLVIVIWQVDWLDMSQAVRVRCLDLRVLWMTDLR